MSPAALDRGGGPAALLLHGQPGRGSDWRSVLELLRPEIRPVAPDRPGYGDNGRPAGGFFLNAEAAVGLLDRLEIETAVVAGHSWGACVAMAMASRFPERVAGLVLVGALVPRARPEPVDRAFASPRFGRMATQLGFWAGGLALSVPPIRRLARHEAPGYSIEDLRGIGGEWRGRRAWRSFYAEQRALIEDLPVLSQEVGSILAPATILSGRHDRISSPARVRALAQALPNSEVRKLDVGGHLLPQQRPDLIAEEIVALA